MNVRRRAALVALAAIVFVSLGLVSDAAAHARSETNRSGQIATHAVRATPGTSAHAERRVQLERVGSVPSSGRTTAGWVRTLVSQTITVAGATVPTCCQSRAPPA